MRIGVGLSLPGLAARRVVPPTPVTYLMADTVTAATAREEQWPVFITADVDPAFERDDEAANALWFGTQDHFNIVRMVASNPDGLASGFTNQIAAYRSDRYKTMSASPYPGRFKTADELSALVVQGAKEANPAKGYRVSGDAEYAQAHAAAQALIADAQAYGSPTSNLPKDKLWVIAQGAFDVVAQAAYEAIELGQLPDLFKRIRVIGQPNFNTGPQGDTPGWTGLTSRSWPTADDPGLYGDLHLLAGYFNWHAFNRNNGGTDAEFWSQRIVAKGAMGAFMDAERAAGNYPQLYFRAGDAGAWLWLMYAKLTGNCDPTNADNWCGRYRSYVGEKWAAQTFGYGADSGIQTQFPNPEHTWFNPHAWAPLLTVNNTGAAAQAAVNLPKWYEVAGETFDRFGAGRSVANPTTRNLEQAGGAFPVVLSLAPPATATQNEAANWQLRVAGVVSSAITVTFSDGQTVTVGTSDGNITINVPRTYAETGVQTMTISTAPGAVIADAGGTVEVMAAGTAEDTSEPYRLEEYRFNDATDVQQIAGAKGHPMIRGTSSTAVDAADFGLVASPSRATFASGQYGRIAPFTGMGGNGGKLWVAVARFNQIAGNQVILGRDDGSGGATRHMQMRLTSGAPTYLRRYATSSAYTLTAPSALEANRWYLLVARENGTALAIRVDGVEVATGTVPGTPTSGGSSDLIVGAREFASQTPSILDSMLGELAYVALYDQLPTDQITAAEQRARDVAASKGITLP